MTTGLVMATVMISTTTWIVVMTVEIAVDPLSSHTIVLIVNAVMLMVAMGPQPMKVNTILKEMIEWTSLIFEGKWPFPGKLDNHDDWGPYIPTYLKFKKQCTIYKYIQYLFEPFHFHASGFVWCERPFYLVNWPQEKWACDFYDDGTPLSFQLQVTGDFF